ncbi:hypothetical protein AB0K23_01235 [Streptomyces sp. NPDC049602]|uniref:hypothetical protein n=1 Tax=Streptomyces sp. NPDC049602 TaxID=3155504 RepID=UPI0034343050
MDPTEHATFLHNGETYTVEAIEHTPGLVLFRLPDAIAPTNPRRWRIGHKPSGLAIADAMQHENGVAGIRKLAELADWTQDADSLQARIDTHELFMALGRIDCIEPNSERMASDVSHNGRYTDADIKEAARAAADEQMDGLELLAAMAHTVPWMGLDTEPFNKAHSRILSIANPAEVAA